MANEVVTKEIAYYYPNPMWDRGDWVKNLILFFDGVALLVPEYMKDKPGIFDPAIVAGLVSILLSISASRKSEH